MSAPQFRALDAVAFQLAALLEKYEEDVEELASRWPDTTLYTRVSREIDEMRLLCASLPLLSVPWVHLLISHAELMHCLWKCTAGGKSRAAEDCKANHYIAIRALREKCLYHFSRMERSH